MSGGSVYISVHHFCTRQYFEKSSNSAFFVHGIKQILKYDIIDKIWMRPYFLLGRVHKWFVNLWFVILQSRQKLEIPKSNVNSLDRHYRFSSTLFKMNATTISRISPTLTSLVTAKPRQATISEAVKASVIVGVIILFFVIFFLWLYCSRNKYRRRLKSDEETIVSDEFYFSE